MTFTQGVATAVTTARQDSRIRIAVGLGLFATVTWLTYLVAYPTMFKGFGFLDDEGYLLISLNSFMNQGSLYDDVFSQYGPFYYEFWGALFSLFGIPVTHDAGRAATLVVWVLSSLVIGISTCRITRSVLLGIGTQVLVFTSLGALTNEPMHPGGLSSLLLAGIVLLSTLIYMRTAAAAMMVLGAAVGALLLTKINVGIFALAAVILTCAATYPALAGRRWWRALIEVGFIVTPFALMAEKLDQSWVQHYVAHVTIAAAAIVIALRSLPADRERSTRELWSLLSGMLGSGFVILAPTLVTGTSLAGLFDGLIAQPLQQPDALTVPLELSDRMIGFDVIALTGAGAYWYVMRDGRAHEDRAWSIAISLLSILIGIGMALSVIGQTLPLASAATGSAVYQLSMLGLGWVALIPATSAESSARMGFAKRLLPALAVLQALHAYPVAGSQLNWSAYLLVPVGAICVSNGIRGLARRVDDQRQRQGLGAIAAVSALVLTIFLANTTLRRPLNDNRAAFDSSVPLGLRGSDTMRVSPTDQELYRQISTAINRECKTFLSLPGLNSFYLWTGKKPPTDLNAGHWMTLFDEEQQRRVVAASRPMHDLCLLRNARLAAVWTGLQPPPDGPLLRFITGRPLGPLGAGATGFKPLARFGDYELLRESTDGR